MENKVYDYVTEIIINQLEGGIIPWSKPWSGSRAVNFVTRKPYRGINALILDGGEYLSFKQVQELGGCVKKGAKSHMVVFYKISAKLVEGAEIEEKGKFKRFFLLRYYNVFRLRDVEGIESKLDSFEHNPIEKAENISNGYSKGPKVINEDLNSAYYSPSKDIINMPKMKQFKEIEKYYSTLFHEMIHSTGHVSRLGRFTGEAAKAAFGSEVYSKEELTAEMGAAMLCSICGIDSTFEHNAAYIQSWLKVLKDDKKFVVQAAGLAQKAADHILGITYEENE